MRDEPRLSTRVDEEEWLDQGIGASNAIEQSLADLNRVNRWLGGTRSLMCHLWPRLRSQHTQPIQILDLGAGGCAIPIAIARWARKAQIPLQVLALDKRHPHLDWARKHLRPWPEIWLVQGDASMPPVPAEGVDIVISSLFLHHFPPRELQQLLPLWARLARGSLVMSDVVRHPLPYWFMKAASPLFARSPITRHDAAVSLRRAYRPHELQAIAAMAGLSGARIFTHIPYRMTLVVDHTETRPICPPGMSH